MHMSVLLCMQRYIAAIACLKKALYLGPFEWIISYNLGLVSHGLCVAHVHVCIRGRGCVGCVRVGCMWCVWGV